MRKIAISKNTIRGFAAGVLVATGVLSLTYYGTASNAPEAKADSTSEQTASAPTAIKKIDMPETQAGTSAPMAKPTYNMTLVIGKGMSPEDAAAKLEENKIIENKKYLVKYLNDMSWMGSVRSGSYEVNSDMTIKEIAALLAHKNKK
ncbi:hypothetical protein DFP93_11622 [Aneurinibacillus soli]|uniref:YceG-like family protein n=1 Tax=Aneurinibacillus soli TaxID=1500254 RepID=A0A0U5B7J0_9BACL|nr:hypothetical protein [Aneurinibacillus soli]PYE59656.1 hypothetical protein DFP93_11622 [Aneurinibacillus soli]BAU29343.1 YceG-like family protein [Aneurinibacillus soli]